MGSIQSLRSWALASRANEDTDVQISGFLGGVNKSLGRQIVDTMDKLQGVIAARTKSYNQLVGNLSRTVDGKDGIAVKAIQSAFTAFRMIQSAIAIAVMAVKITNAKAADKPDMEKEMAAMLVSIGGTAIANYLTGLGFKETVKSAVYDYEKMASQLGYVEFKTRDWISDNNFTPFVPVSDPLLNEAGLHTGASSYVDMRDALMPRSSATRQTNLVVRGGNPGATYIGTLRRL